MNRKHTFVATAVLLVLAALYLILRPDGSRDSDSTGSDGKARPPVRIRPGNSPGADGTGGDSKEVSLPGLPPVRYSGRRDMTMSQLVQKFDALDELFPESMVGRDIILGKLQSHSDILTDDKGNLVALYRNRGMIPTEDRTALAIERFRKEGVEITRMGNGVATMENRAFVLGLVALLERHGLDRMDGNSEEFRLVPYEDIEIIPVTARANGLEASGIPENRELPALLLKKKNIHGDPDPTESPCEWTEPFRYYESHEVEWQIIFINPNPENGDISKFFLADIRELYPGICIGRFYEKRLPRPGEPPITPPVWNPTTREWKMWNDPR